MPPALWSGPWMWYFQRYHLRMERWASSTYLIFIYLHSLAIVFKKGKYTNTHAHTHTQTHTRTREDTAWLLMGTHKGALCAAAAPAGAKAALGALTCGGESRSFPARSIAGGGRYAPAPASPGCCPGPRAPPSPGSLGLRAPGVHFIAGVRGPPACSPRPAPQPPPGSWWTPRGDGRSLGARGRARAGRRGGRGRQRGEARGAGGSRGPAPGARRGKRGRPGRGAGA